MRPSRTAATFAVPMAVSLQALLRCRIAHKERSPRRPTEAITRLRARSAFHDGGRLPEYRYNAGRA